MIAFLVAVQMLAAPSAEPDTAAMNVSSAMRTISVPSTIESDTLRSTDSTRSHRTRPTHPTHSGIAPEADAWLGADKFKHAAMSYAITAYAFAVTDSEPVAVASAAITGILKEIYDRRRGSLFSVRDLVWDAAGVALGYAVVKQTR